MDNKPTQEIPEPESRRMLTERIREQYPNVFKCSRRVCAALPVPMSLYAAFVFFRGWRRAIGDSS